MQAIRLHEHDGPELLTLREIERPEPDPDEVHIDAEVIGVNSINTYFGASVRTPVHTGTRRSWDRQRSRLARQPVRHFCSRFACRCRGGALERNFILLSAETMADGNLRIADSSHYRLFSGNADPVVGAYR